MKSTRSVGNRVSFGELTTSLVLLFLLWSNINLSRSCMRSWVDRRMTRIQDEALLSLLSVGKRIIVAKAASVSLSLFHSSWIVIDTSSFSISQSILVKTRSRGRGTSILDQFIKYKRVNLLEQLESAKACTCPPSTKYIRLQSYSTPIKNKIFCRAAATWAIVSPIGFIS